MDSPLQEPEDSVSSIIRGVHEDEMRELAAVIKELREQAARDAELITELRGQAEDNARAIGV
jgi:cytochrome c553